MLPRSLGIVTSILYVSLTPVHGFVLSNAKRGIVVAINSSRRNKQVVSSRYYRSRDVTAASGRMASSFTAAPTTTMSASAVGSDMDNKSLFLFDFDGVVCDSCDECTVSALRTLKTLKALDEEKNDSPPTLEYPPDWLFKKMREIRPAIEVGWQIPVLLSVFLEQQRKQEKDGITMMSVAETIANYEKLVKEWLLRRKLKEENMVDTFGGVRDKWIGEDLNSWLEINKFYPKVPNSLNNCQGKSVLVTTKQQRFAIALCRHAGVTKESLPDDLIYGLGQYKKKSDVIVDQMTSGGYLPQQTYFFEDRWPTIAKCLKDDRLEGVRLHLCSWGYVTKQELALAQAEPRVTVLGLDAFATIVQGN